MRKVLQFIILALSMAACLRAADRNEANLRGRVYAVRTHNDSNGPYRVEVILFDQAPANGPYSPSFDCADWSQCQAAPLLATCAALLCRDASEGGSQWVRTCSCDSAALAVGVCLEVKAYHDGFRLLSTSVQVRDASMCTAVP